MLRVALTALALIGPIALFLLPIAYFNWIPPRWMGSLVALFSVALMFEVASYYQFSPRQGFVEDVFKKYPAARDRIVYLIAAIVFLVIFFLSLSIESLSILPTFAFILLGWLIAYGICVSLGTQALREGVTPQWLKRMLR